VKTTKPKMSLLWRSFHITYHVSGFTAIDDEQTVKEMTSGQMRCRRRICLIKQACRYRDAAVIDSRRISNTIRQREQNEWQVQHYEQNRYRCQLAISNED